jgi:CheY-like chemotaxis protein
VTWKMDVMVPDSSKILADVSVLVIEDNADSRYLTEQMLAQAGAKVDKAADGDEGYAKALLGTYSLVLLDSRMPGLDGNTVARRLRRAGYQRPIVALTASAMPGEREAGLRAGHDGYLVKPIAAKALVDAVASFARRALLP